MAGKKMGGKKIKKQFNLIFLPLHFSAISIYVCREVIKYSIAFGTILSLIDRQVVILHG